MLAKLEKESAAARVSGFKGLFYKPLEKQVVLTNPEFKFDFIFLDPPYANEKEYDGTLRALQKSSLIGSSTIVIVEHRKSFELPATYGPFERFRVLRQGDAALTFYKLA